MTFDYDVLILGGGPGGVDTAIHAARQKLKTAIISSTPIGGRAIWNSLLPSKVWVHAAETFDHLRRTKNEPVHARHFEFDLALLRNEINAKSTQTSDQYRNALVQHNIEILTGQAKIRDEHHVQLEQEDNNRNLSAKNIIIASGSGPYIFEGVKPNGERIIAPRFAKNLNELPGSIIMVGGGVTGCEFAYVFSALGSNVTILTDQPQLLPQMDNDIQIEIEKIFRDRGLQIHTSSPVQKVEQNNNEVTVEVQSGKSVKADYAFLALGRKADTDFLNEKLNFLKLTDAGNIEVNSYGQTNIPHIYAIGDVTGNPMTANKALQQARYAVHHIAGHPVDSYRPDLLIQPVYTNPPIASVGLTEQQAREEGYKLSVIKKSYDDLIKSNISGEIAGFLKIIIDLKTDKVLGASAIGPQAPDILTPVMVAMKSGLIYHQLKNLPYPYPTYSELILE